MKKIFIKIIFLLTTCNYISAEENFYISSNKCINDLYSVAISTFSGTNIKVLRDPRGIVLRYQIFTDNYSHYKNLKVIEYFLAKIENPAIIEVHTEKKQGKESGNLKNWEFSTILANEIESSLISQNSKISRKRIKSVGYGEFLPIKNTPNNGGNYTNRIDIIILCNISGE